MTRSFLFCSQRLGFGTWTPEDLLPAKDLWCSGEVTELFGGPFSEEYVEERLVREIETQAALGYQYWPIFLLDTGEFVGCCGITPHDEPEEIVMTGYHLLPEFWGRGLGEEAARAAVNYGFNVLGVKTIFAGHHPENHGSQRILEKIGFEYQGDEFYPPTGRQHRTYLIRRAVDSSPRL